MAETPSFPPRFDRADVSDNWKGEHALAPEDRDPSTRYSLVTDMYHWCSPVFSDPKYSRKIANDYYQMDHHLIGDKLREVGVTLPDECVEDHESGGFYIYFSARKKANAWIDRLNAWLAKQCEGMENPANALEGYDKIHHELRDPDGEYAIIGRADLDRIKALAREHGIEGQLLGLDILIENYRDIHPA